MGSCSPKSVTEVPVTPPVVVTEPPTEPTPPVTPSKPATDFRDVRDKNNERAFGAVAQWCVANRYEYEPYAQRLALALVTESSGGYIYANDGGAYDSTKKTQWNGGLSKELQDSVRAVLRNSLNKPYDKIGNNGRSTGMLQQISLESNQALYQKKNTWGWGSVDETINPETSALMFVKALRITSNSQYGDVSTLSPVIADTLRVQQPLASEVAKNYGQKQLTWALELAKNPSRYFTDL